MSHKQIIGIDYASGKDRCVRCFYVGGVMQYDDLFPKPLEEMSDDELKELALELKKKQKYPAIQKAQDKKKDAVADLVNKFVSKADKK